MFGVGQGVLLGVVWWRGRGKGGEDGDGEGEREALLGCELRRM